MVYPTPGFVVKNSFLEFEESPPQGQEPRRGRSQSDSDLCHASWQVTVSGFAGPSQPGNGRYKKLGDLAGRPCFKLMAGRLDVFIYCVEGTWCIGPDMASRELQWAKMPGGAGLPPVGLWEVDSNHASGVVEVSWDLDLPPPADFAGGSAARGPEDRPRRRSHTVDHGQVARGSGQEPAVAPGHEPGAAAEPGEENEEEEKAPAQAAAAFVEAEATTVLLENLPVQYTRDLLVETMNGEGFAASFDFVYLPMDLVNKAGNGYALVNFVSHEQAVRALQHFEGFTQWKAWTPNACTASWSRFHQGLAAHVERYRNSPVMHDKVPDVCKPTVFRDGRAVPFPAPTRRLRFPRLRPKKGAPTRDRCWDCGSTLVGSYATPTMVPVSCIRCAVCG